MWKLIRGCGLSYSYGIRMVQNEACLLFSLYKATNAVAAYSKAKSIVVSLHFMMLLGFTSVGIRLKK